jgi:hypothetical protein
MLNTIQEHVITQSFVPMQDSINQFIQDFAKFKLIIYFLDYVRRIYPEEFENNTLICFQHKMADAISIPMYLFHNGTYISYNNEKSKFSLRHVGSFFNNCPKSEYIEEITADINEFKRCPPTYYKKIVYTYEGKVINPNELDKLQFEFKPIHIPTSKHPVKFSVHEIKRKLMEEIYSNN